MMEQRSLGQSGLTVPPLVFGGNVFGWTVNEADSFRLLDAMVDAGLTTIDTADVYSRFAPGNQGGESEAIIGKWLAAEPSRRARISIHTKVGSDMGGPDRQGLSGRWIAEAVEGSLKRLNTDVIDLYYAHKPDPGVPLEETLGAFAKLIQAGKVRAVGGSNYDAAGLAEALAAADDAGLPRYSVLQPHYNLVERDKLEGPLLDLCVAEDIGVLPYFALASGFLTGKYRSEADLKDQARARLVGGYINPKGLQVLDTLDTVAARQSAAPAEVALAWMMAQPGVTAPIASATSERQLESLVRACRLKLSSEDLAALDAASA